MSVFYFYSLDKEFTSFLRPFRSFTFFNKLENLIYHEARQAKFNLTALSSNASNHLKLLFVEQT